MSLTHALYLTAFFMRLCSSVPHDALRIGFLLLFFYYHYNYNHLRHLHDCAYIIYIKKLAPLALPIGLLELFVLFVAIYRIVFSALQFGHHLFLANLQLTWRWSGYR